MKRKPPEVRRPTPPPVLVENLFQMRFRPAPEVLTWAREVFVDEDGELHNPEHAHLAQAKVGILWATTGYTKAGRRIIGATEDLRLSFGNPWAKARGERQFDEWFGTKPDFLITLDAWHCSQCSDVEFCALVEHELYHIGHRRDEFGEPAYGKDGQPKLAIRGHDVEEFVGIVRRYGVGDPEGMLASMIIAAAKGPSVAPVQIAQACGTCQLRAAA